MITVKPSTVPWLREPPYRVPRHPAPTQLRLDGNEGLLPPEQILKSLKNLTANALKQYPDAHELESKLARHFNLPPESVLVTAGGDDALLRMCRAFLCPGRNLVVPSPTFEMIPRFTLWCGASTRLVSWVDSAYPIDEVLNAVDADTSVIAVVSPNNPTGSIASPNDLRRLSVEAPGSMIMLDAAYIEFADEDLTEVALSLPNALIFRTFSKARGLAGLRIGYVMGASQWISSLRAVGLPYPVSSASLLLAKSSIDNQSSVDDFVSTVRKERKVIANQLANCGWEVPSSQGNFVFAHGLSSQWWRDALASLGIGIRIWPNDKTLANAIRITCPGNKKLLTQLTTAIQTVAKPEAILFDIDGVLANVSSSYRRTIKETVAHFGQTVTDSDVEAVKYRSNTNNDWRVTQMLLAERGCSVSLEAIRRRFDEIYVGLPGEEGLRRYDSFIGDRSKLTSLSKQFSLGVITGRPRRDAEHFLSRFKLNELFKVVITMEDGPPKPSGVPVELSLQKLNVKHAWMLGDTKDDIEAARSARVLPIGIIAPKASIGPTSELLLHAGASVVLNKWTEIMELLP